MVKVMDVFADDLDEAIDRAAQEPISRQDFAVLEYQKMAPPRVKQTPYRNN